MPPSPRIEATIDKDRFAQLCNILGVCIPEVRFKRGSNTLKDGRRCWGVYNTTTNNITIFVELNFYEDQPLKSAQLEMNRTLLHELRHHWQHYFRRDKISSETWMEGDAERYAQEQVVNWPNIVRLSRQTKGGFKRLSKYANR